MTEDLRPVPVPDGDTAPYWEAARKHVLALPRCTACRRYFFPPRALCPDCLVPPEWAEVSGRGTVHAFTIMRESFMKGFPPPYVVADVELEEQSGLKLVTNIVGCDVTDVRIGQPLVTFEDRSPRHLPFPPRGA